MKTLTARQAELAGRRTLKPIPLVILTTYLDRTTKTVDQVHYFSDRAVSYDYGDTGTLKQFLPFVDQLDPIARQIPHLANAQSGGLLLNDRLSIRLRNGEIDGTGETLFQSFQYVEMTDSQTATGGSAKSINGIFNVPPDKWSGNVLRMTGGPLAGVERVCNSRGSAASLNIRGQWPSPFPANGDTFETWRSEVLEGALLEIGELLIDPDKPATSTGALVGDEHLIFYRGFIERLHSIGETMTLDIGGNDYSMNFWPIGGPPADPIDRGAFANVVYGDVKGIPCQGVNVGAVGLLSVPIDDLSEEDIVIDNTDDWPTSGDGWIGMELFSWTGKNTALGSLTGITRGTTNAVAHGGGAIVSEIVDPEARFAVAVHPIYSFSRFYALNPLDGKLLPLISGTHGSVNITDSSVPEFPFTWSSVTITPTQMAFVKSYFEAQVDFDSPTAPTEETETDTFTVIEASDSDDYDNNNSEFHAGQVNIVTSTATLEEMASPPAFVTPAIVCYVTGLTSTANDRINEWRIRVTARVESGAPDPSSFNNEARFRVYNVPANSDPAPGGGTDETLHEMTITAPQDGFVIQESVSRWFAADGDLRLGNFNGTGGPSYDEFFVSVHQRYTSGFPARNNSGYNVQVTITDVILESKPFDDTSLVVRTADANTLTRMSGGQGLRIYVDGTGVVAPNDTDYSVGVDEPLLNPPDILRHMITERAGLPSSVIDDGPGSTWEAALAEIGDQSAGFVSSDYEEDWAGQIGQFCYENRCQLTFEEANAGTLFKLLLATKIDGDNFAYQSSGRTITEWQRVEEDTRELNTIFTRWRWNSEPNRPLLDQGYSQSEALFSRAVTVDIAGSDLAPDITSEDMDLIESRYGARDAPAQYLVAPRPDSGDAAGDNAWADEVSEYYVSESKRVPAATVAMFGVPWVQGYDLELGDVVDVQLEWWVSPRSIRLLGYTKHWSTGLIDLIGIEVNAE